MLKNYINLYKYEDPAYVTLIYNNVMKMSLETAKNIYKDRNKTPWFNSPTDRMELLMIGDRLCIETGLFLNDSIDEEE